MNVTEKTLAGLDDFLKEHLEADIIAIIAERRSISPAEAMRLYYGSPLSESIESGTYGMQYLDATYLAEEILKAS